MKRENLFSHEKFFLLTILVCISISGRGQYSSFSGSILTPDLRISGYGNHGAYHQYAPRVASNGTNGFLVVWEDPRNGYPDIWGQALNQDGSAIGGNFRISSDPSNRRKHDPVCAMDAEGNSLVIWVNNNYLFAKCFDADRAVLTDEYRVSPSAMYGDQAAVIPLIGGGFLGALIYDNTDQIYLQVFNQKGEKSGSYTFVYDGDCQEIIHLQLLQGSDVFYLSWVENTYGEYKQFLMTLNPDLSVRATAYQIRQSNRDFDFLYDMVLDSQENLMLIYPVATNTSSEVHTRLFNKDCQEVQADIKVSPDTGGTFNIPRIAKKNGSSNLVVFLHGSYNSGQLGVFQFTDGNDADDFQLIGDDLGTVFFNYQKSDLELSKNTTGNQLIVFLDRRNHLYPNWSGDTDVYGQLLSSTGSVLGSNFKINDDQATEVDCYPSVTIDADNNKSIVWQYREFFNPEILMQRVDANGNLDGVNSLVNDDPDSLDQFRPAIARGYGDYDLVVWSDARDEDNIQIFEIFGQLYTKAGQKAGNNFIIRDGKDVSVPGNCAVAPRPDGSFIVVWEERNDNWRSLIRGRQVSQNGSLPGDIFTVSSATPEFDCEGPDIQIDSGGNAVVIWAVTSEKTIYARLFDNTMSPLGDPFAAYITTEYGLNRLPKLGMSSNGNFCVLAEHGGGIFFQCYLSDGSPSGSPVEVTDRRSANGVSEVDVAPSIVMSPDGTRIVVAWTSDKYKSNYPKIFARVYQNGEPVGVIERINEQGYQPNAHAYLWKNGLVCNDDQVVFVWSENRTNRNLDIYCKVTNWNLTGLEEYQLSVPKLEMWPIPVSEELFFGGTEGDYMIYSTDGKLIRELSQVKSWDLRDQHGSRVSAGVYIVKSVANHSGRVVVK